MTSRACRLVLALVVAVSLAGCPDATDGPPGPTETDAGAGALAGPTTPAEVIEAVRAEGGGPVAVFDASNPRDRDLLVLGMLYAARIMAGDVESPARSAYLEIRAAHGLDPFPALDWADPAATRAGLAELFARGGDRRALLVALAEHVREHGGERGELALRVLGWPFVPGEGELIELEEGEEIATGRVDGQPLWFVRPPGGAWSLHVVNLYGKIVEGIAELETWRKRVDPEALAARVEAARVALRGDDPAKRREALAALVRIELGAAAAAVPELMAVLRTGEHPKAVAAALGRIGTAAVAPLLEVVGDEDAALRLRAIKTLARAGQDDPAPVVERLAPLLENADSTDGRAAIATIGTLGGPGAPHLLALLARLEPGEVRWATIRALAHVGPEPGVAEALAAIATTADDPQRAAAIKALGALGTVARPTLEPLLADPAVGGEVRAALEDVRLIEARERLEGDAGS